MDRIILFPFRFEDDNRKAFAFTIELARRSNKDIIALISLDLRPDQTQNKKNIERVINDKKNDIYCNLLQMKGFYHGRFNQWNACDEIKIHIQITLHDLNGAICSAINDHTDPVVILQEKYFSGTGILEEISSNFMHGSVSFYIIPRESEFEIPSSDLMGVIFQNQKKFAFRKVFSETKIFDLPEDYDEFREEMILQHAG
jgi:hypothetical protein